MSVLLLSVALAIPACGKVERELPEYADDKTMTLGAWGAPIPTQEGYNIFAEAGFNCTFWDWRQLTTTAFQNVMGYAENAGVKIWVQTGNEHYNQPEVIQKVYDASSTPLLTESAFTMSRESHSSTTLGIWCRNLNRTIRTACF